MHWRGSAGMISSGAGSGDRAGLRSRVADDQWLHASSSRAGDCEVIVPQLEGTSRRDSATGRHDAWGTRANAAVVAAPNAPALACAGRRIVAASVARDVLCVPRDNPLA